MGEKEEDNTVLPQADEEEVVEYAPVDKSKKPFISQTEILSILLSKETLYHVLVLFLVLVLFGILSFTKSDIALQIIISLGYGVSLGYFVTANLNRFEGFNKLSRTKDVSSVIIPLLISLFFSIFIWLGLHHSIYERNVERFLSFGLIFIFLIWQFAQAWWMRIPFREIALRRMSKSPTEGSSKIGLLANILAPFSWAIFGYIVFTFVANNVPKFSDNFDNSFAFFWFLMIFILGGISFYLLKQMHRDFWYNPQVASFSAYFSIGYWGFLSYHAGVLLYSMYNKN